MSVSGMPGQPPGSKQGSLSNSGKEIAVAIIKRKVEDMMNLPNGKNVLTTKTVQGGIIAALGILFGVASKVLSGDLGWTDPETIRQVFGAIGIIWAAIGARRAIANSNPANTPQ